jgi:GMP synthase-like glutamine amidotransferase
VRKNAVKEIGWGEVTPVGNAESRAWFGEMKSAIVFHWHGETFSLPNGATHLLSSKHCTNQAYALGKHLALQCHVEMTEAMIREWCEIGAEEIATNLHSEGVQSATAIQSQIAQNLTPLHKLAEQLYTKWIEGLEFAAK